jgi:death on curing protein
MRYVTINDIQYIHDQIVGEIGGSLGVREPELLASIVAKPQASFGGEELYADLYAKAAALYEALCNYRVFVDGNKRTAALTLYRFLVVNGYDLTASNDELERYTLAMATSHPDLAEVAKWVKKHSKPVA